MDDQARRQFGDFAADRTPALIRVAYLLCGDQDAAADLVQNALVKTAARWRTPRHADPRVGEPLFEPAQRLLLGAVSAGGYLLVVAANFAYFYPIYTGRPIAYAQWLARMWLGSRWY